MNSAINTAHENAVQIRRIVEAHRFSEPRIVAVDDPDYDITLLVTPLGHPTLLDIGELVLALQEGLNIHAFILTDSEFEATFKRTGVEPETRRL